MTPEQLEALEARHHCAIDFEPMDEDVSPLDMLDCEEDARDILERVEYDLLAWFCAKVTATCEATGLSGVVYLGCCCYRDEDEFRSDPYFDDLVREAIDMLEQERSDMRAGLDYLAATAPDHHEPGCDLLLPGADDRGLSCSCRPTH